MVGGATRCRFMTRLGYDSGSSVSVTMGIGDDALALFSDPICSESERMRGSGRVLWWLWKGVKEPVQYV